MTRFFIEFQYEEVKYSADVTRIAGGPVQYHIYNIQPVILNIPLPFIMIWNYQEKQLQWGIPTGLFPFAFAGYLAAAIYAKLDELGISPG